jgi:hypothetical protein
VEGASRRQAIRSSAARANATSEIVLVGFGI